MVHVTVAMGASADLLRQSGGLRMHRNELLTCSMPGALRLPSLLPQEHLPHDGRKAHYGPRPLTSTPPLTFSLQPQRQHCCTASRSFTPHSTAATSTARSQCPLYHLSSSFPSPHPITTS